MDFDDRIKRYYVEPLSDLDRDLNIVDLYLSGYSHKTIGETLGLSKFIVNKAIDKHKAMRVKNLTPNDTIANCECECALCGDEFMISRAEKKQRMMHFCSRGCMTIGLKYVVNLGREAYELARYKRMTWIEVAAELGYANIRTANVAAKKHARKYNLKWPLKYKGNKKKRSYIKRDPQ